MARRGLAATFPPARRGPLATMGPGPPAMADWACLARWRRAPRRSNIAADSQRRPRHDANAPPASRLSNTAATRRNIAVPAQHARGRAPCSSLQPAAAAIYMPPPPPRQAQSKTRASAAARQGKTARNARRAAPAGLRPARRSAGRHLHRVAELPGHAAPSCLTHCHQAPSHGKPMVPFATSATNAMPAAPEAPPPAAATTNTAPRAPACERACPAAAGPCRCPG